MLLLILLSFLVCINAQTVWLDFSYADDTVTYFADLSLGSPGQQLNVAFDLTKSASWTLSTQTTRPMNNHYVYYNHDLSNTYSSDGSESWNVTYLDGWAKGFTSKDNWCLSSGYYLCANSFTFGEATDNSDSYDYQYGPPVDATIGLAFGDDSAGNANLNKFLDVLVGQGTLTNRTFGLFLSYTYGESFIRFGATADQDMYTGALTQVPTVTLEKSPGSWAINVDSMNFDNYPKVTCRGQPCQAMLDTTQPMITVPQYQFCNILYGLGCSYCNNVTYDYACYYELNTMTVHINGHLITLNNQDLMDDDGYLMIDYWNEDYIIFGTVLFTKVYTFFNMDTNTVGFGKLYTDNASDFWMWFWIVSGSILAGLCFCCCFVCGIMHFCNNGSRGGYYSSLDDEGPLLYSAPKPYVPPQFTKSNDHMYTTGDAVFSSTAFQQQHHNGINNNIYQPPQATMVATATVPQAQTPTSYAPPSYSSSAM